VVVFENTLNNYHNSTINIFEDLFESSGLAIKDEVENTIRKRIADAVKTAKFLCIMAASIIGLSGVCT
jgi:hypothetical protein